MFNNDGYIVSSLNQECQFLLAYLLLTQPFPCLICVQWLTQTTDDVLLIEDGPYGTTCARVGCMPSKLLIAAAEAAHAGAHTAPMGVTYAAPQIDGAAVMARGPVVSVPRRSSGPDGSSARSTNPAGTFAAPA